MLSRRQMLQSSALGFANLAFANLQGVKLQGAKLVGANLNGAKLTKVQLQGVLNLPSGEVPENRKALNKILRTLSKSKI